VLTVLLETAGGSWTIDTEEEPRRVALNEDRGMLARVIREAARASERMTRSRP